MRRSRQNTKRGRSKHARAHADATKRRRQCRSNQRAPVCPECNRPCRLATKAEVNPTSKTHSDREFWVCRNWPDCGNMTAADFWSGKARGKPASASVRWHRRYGHVLMSSVASALGRRGTGVVYKMLSDHLGIPVEKTHWGMFDLETARRAVRFLKGWLHDRNLPIPSPRASVHREGGRRPAA